MAQQYGSVEQVQLQKSWSNASAEAGIWYNNACMYTQGRLSFRLETQKHDSNYQKSMVLEQPSIRQTGS